MSQATWLRAFGSIWSHLQALPAPWKASEALKALGNILLGLRGSPMSTSKCADNVQRILHRFRTISHRFLRKCSNVKLRFVQRSNWSKQRIEQDKSTHTHNTREADGKSKQNDTRTNEPSHMVGSFWEHLKPFASAPSTLKSIGSIEGLGKHTVGP